MVFLFKLYKSPCKKPFFAIFLPFLPALLGFAAGAMIYAVLSELMPDIISEKGSILSHTAIIARELKIPAIVGVEEATTCIKTGDYLKMDASSGKIEILKRSNK